MAAPPRSEIAKRGGEPRFWPEVPDQAEVIAATFLGGKNTEWLCGGGFQADGTIVVAGDSLGPELALAVPETVIGADLPPPGEYKPVAVLDRRAPGTPGRPKVDKGGKPVFEKPSWRHANATGFVARLSADLKRVLSVSRLPWSSGAITTAIVDPQDGSIYIAGRAGEGIARLGGDFQVVEVAADGSRKEGQCQHTFVAKLTADGSKAVWVRTSKGPSDAPQLSLRGDGTVAFGAQDLRIFDAGGRLLSNLAVPGGVRETTSVSPIDGTIVRGGEHHWPTGREPWRCPTLNFLKPDGTLRYQLYDWGGPYVGLDNCRQVADSAIRMVSHDRDGNVLLFAWSDGGNSVMTSFPADVRRGVGLPGLGLNSAGAGVTSFAYLVRLEPKDYQVIGYTFWCSKLGPKANGIGIDAIATADDGSVCIAGGSAWGLIQTQNRIAAPDAEPGGPYIAVFSGDLSRARFVSAIPGVEAAQVNNNHPWAVVTGKQNGKPRALFLAGATKEADVYGRVSPTPITNALQSTFGGGESDGYLVLVDLSQGTRPSAKAEPNSAPPDRLTYRRDAHGKGGKHDIAAPTTDTEFFFSAEYPKYVTVDAEFRDAKAAQWPSFLYGKPIEGSATWKDGRLSAKVAVSCSSWCQPAGQQDRRVIHQLIADSDKPPVLTFRLDALESTEKEEVKEINRRGKEEIKMVDYAVGKATLAIGGRTLALAPKVTWTLRAVGRDNARVGIRMTVWFTFKGREIGLTGKLADEEIDSRISWTGEEGSAPPLPQPKNRELKNKQFGNEPR